VIGQNKKNVFLPFLTQFLSVAPAFLLLHTDLPNVHVGCVCFYTITLL